MKLGFAISICPLAAFAEMAIIAIKLLSWKYRQKPPFERRRVGPVFTSVEAS